MQAPCSTRETKPRPACRKLGDHIREYRTIELAYADLERLIVALDLPSLRSECVVTTGARAERIASVALPFGHAWTVRSARTAAHAVIGVP